jgi:phage shock protein PspC (stress-responsive transcriptional regulator)
MTANQTIVTLTELEPALEEIGVVQVPGGATAPEPSRDTGRDAARPLRQVSEGAVVSGVCQGLARYFALDVTLLRVIAVLLLLGTGGGMFFVYLALMLLMPYAPLAAGAASLRWLPAKCRRFVEFLRAKLGVERTGDMPA